MRIADLQDYATMELPLLKQGMCRNMGITVHYKTITPEDFERLQSDPKTANLFLLEESIFSLEKSWHVIHYLLTDHFELEKKPFTDPPFGSVVMGGTPTQFECSFEVVRYLTPEEVSITSEALNKISLETLEAKCTADNFNDAEIYPLGRSGRWDEEEIEGEIRFLRILYPSLVSFFQEAASDGDVILIACD